MECESTLSDLCTAHVHFDVQDTSKTSLGAARHALLHTLLLQQDGGRNDCNTISVNILSADGSSAVFGPGPL